MPNQLLELAIDNEVLGCVSPRLAHCFEILPIAFGKPQDTLIVATHVELGTSLRINFREHCGFRIAKQGITNVEEFFEALNYFYPIAAVNMEYQKCLSPVINVSPILEMAPINAMLYRVVQYAEKHTVEIGVKNDLYGTVSVAFGNERGTRDFHHSIHMIEMLISRLKNVHLSMKQFDIQERANQNQLRLAPANTNGG